MDTRRLVTPWDGWSWYEDYLTDPDGNRYSPEMIKSSLFAFELAHSLTGSTLQIRIMRDQLREKLKTPPPEIVVRWQGQETIIKPPKWTLKI